MYHKDLHIHLVGIGGIGMSGIALLLKQSGYTVSGCDKDLKQQSVYNLINTGVTVYEGNNTHACHDASISTFVYSSSISLTNPELIAAQEHGIPVIHRSTMLAELMRPYFSIAVSGMHGKTTTTSLITHILMYAGIDPTYAIGGLLSANGYNAHKGNSVFFVAEADESDRSFLNLPLTLAVVTNIDLEHLETYRDINDIRSTFEQFLSHLPFYGKAFLCNDDPEIARLSLPATCIIVTYGISATSDIRADNCQLYSSYSTFDVYAFGMYQGSVTVALPGHHNILNALAALAVSLEVRLPFATSAAALATFAGVERRFSFRGTFQGASIYDDYGHHPKEIACTLRIARAKTNGPLTVVFQPHRYTRTHALWQDFVALFAHETIDNLIITDIYAASEPCIDGVTSQKLVEEIKKVQPNCAITYVPYDDQFLALQQKVQTLTDTDGLILLLGAGNVYRLAQLLAA